MNSKKIRYTKEILDCQGIEKGVYDFTPKQNKVIMKKLKKLLKDIELLRRVGGVTLIVEGDSVITAYHNNSMNRKLNMNNNKVIY